MKPLRILYVITKANWGGAQRYVYDLAVAAQAAGHVVRVISGPEGALTRKLAEADIESVSLPSLSRDVSLGSEWHVFTELREQIREFEPDIVHGNSSKAGGLAALASRTVGGAHTIFTAHGWAFNEARPLWQRLLIWLAHYATVLLADRTICNSKATCHDARQMPFVRERLVVIHNGIGPIDFYTREDARERLAPALSFPFWVGTIAELHPTKQIPVLIRAFKDVAAKHADAALVLIGDGEERTRLERYVKRLDLEKRVVFCGHVDEAARSLPALDLFVLPSHTESLGYVLMEAGRAGLPVVASRVGGIPEIVESGVSGALVRPDSYHLLATALETLIADPSLRSRYASNLKVRVEEKFSLERMTQKTIALYHSLRLG
jgi:glycosyltransferase involved in cell wall biosynthesis